MVNCAFFLLPLSFLCTYAATLHTGPGFEFETPDRAAAAAVAGDTVLIHDAVYEGTFYISNVLGTEAMPIVFRGESTSGVIFRGGTESLHFSRCGHLIIENFTVERQTGNGMNIDDGGEYDSPVRGFVIRNVTFREMAATGNNDMLKMSGVDEFRIENCTFTNGSPGGSGIDFVGCHHGVITKNTFRNMGSNAIQAKGGTQHLLIAGNSFTDCGHRSINLGGNTSLAYFRPPDARFEAADILVAANVFTGSTAPVGFVGCTRVRVVNNLIQQPQKWAFRILQETVDETRFVPCGNNMFCNNIIIYDQNLSTLVNIGPNTAPETFVVSHNVWYNGSSVTTLPTVGLPFTETNSLAGVDPMLQGMCPLPQSPVVGAGRRVEGLTVDYSGKPFGVPPSIGACETDIPVSVAVKPLPCNRLFTVLGYSVKGAVVDVCSEWSPCRVFVYDGMGRLLSTHDVTAGIHVLDGIDHRNYLVGKPLPATTHSEALR